MATQVIKTIRASGGDYSTLSSFLSAVPSDLVAVDEQWVADCYNDWPSGLVENITINSRTTDTTRNIVIRGSDSDGTEGPSRPNGIPGNGFYLVSTLNGTAITVKDKNTVIDGIGVKSNNTTLTRTAIAIAIAKTDSTSRLEVKNCAIWSLSAAANSITIGYNDRVPVFIYNNYLFNPFDYFLGKKVKI